MRSKKKNQVFLSRNKMTNRAKAKYENEFGEEALEIKLKLRSPGATDMVAKRLEDKLRKRISRALRRKEKENR